MAKKYTKIGIVRTSEKSKNAFIALGNAKSENKKYRFHTEVRVTDDDGNVLAYVKDGILSVQDPRTNPNKTEDQVANLPAWLLKEIYIVEDNK